jgi:hypothetical protein
MCRPSKAVPAWPGHVDGAHHPAARGIEHVDPIAGREPDVLAVEGDASHLVDAREGAIFVDDLGGRSVHDFHPHRVVLRAI